MNRHFRQIVACAAVVTFQEKISVAQKIAEVTKDPNVEYAEPVFKAYITEIHEEETEEPIRH